MTMNKAERADQQDRKDGAVSYLRKRLAKNTLVYTILRHVSASGMTRHIKCVIPAGNKIEDITWYVANAIDHKRHTDGGLVVGGCGMDMGFHVIYSLSSVLYPQGHKCDGKQCHSNDHTNRVNTKHHKSGGYRLHQQWI